ncbi:MAG TPA: LysM peptidoglycan-binding domain-containing protein [Chloroflexi bacterium]|nr:LysM peptidoglycan-binding domain-containing protein [Chloroflexota bacterium]
MKTNRFLTLVIAAFLMLGLAACNRSASSGPTGQQGAGENPTQPVPNPNELNAGFVTQTAVAAGVNAQPPEATQPPAVQPTTAAPAQPAPTAVPPQPTEEAPPAIPTPKVPAKYTLQPGEFPYCIARRFDINPDQLLAANNMGKASQSYPGQTLVIPQNAKPFPGKRALAAHPTKYTVRAGDTIYTIACTFGDVSPDAIIAANSLSKPYTLQAGQVLQIP